MRAPAERLLLIFSLALNVAFVATAAVVHHRSGSTTPVAVSEPPRFSTQWHGRRARAMDRRLHLERHQRRILRQQLNTFRPDLEATRRELITARRSFREALRRDDPQAVRAARQQVSRVQARLDSLTAEAMLAEIEVLQPEQRERYVRWTFERPRAWRPRKRPAPDEEP